MENQSISLYIIRIFDKVITVIFVLFLLSLLVFGSYSIWDSEQIYAVGKSSQYEIYKPSAENQMSFEELQAINDDVIGWLNVYDTKIDYPLLQAKDNQKYLNTNAEGNYSMAGSIFLDYRNASDFTDFNTIIYGHHMEQSAMFGDLEKFFDEAFFDSHPYGNIYFNEEDHGIEFFAFMQIDAFDSEIFSTPVIGQSKETYLSAIYNRAMYTRNLDISTDDQLILLSTCTANKTNGRHLLIGRIVDDVFPAPVEEDAEIHSFDFSSKFPFSYLVGIGLFLLLLILITIYTKYRMTRKRE